MLILKEEMFLSDLRLHELPLPLGPKLWHYMTLLFRINFSDYAISLHDRVYFELVPQLCKFLRCCKAYLVDIDYITQVSPS